MTANPFIDNFWGGELVSKNLALEIANTPDQMIDIEDIVGLALRRNPKRAHLLVSKVLGKHIPASPALIIGSGQLLGAGAYKALGGNLPPLDSIWGTLRDSLKGSSVKMPEVPRPTTDSGAVVVGYAETATSLGHIVADYLGAPYIHSTRYGRPDAVEYGTFEEAHSHATTHKLLPENQDMLNNDHPLVLVDDELSTGKTVIATIQQLHALSPRKQYVVCSLIDCRSQADKDALAEFANGIGASIDVIALSHGEVILPDDVMDKASNLLNQMEQSSLMTYDVHFVYPETKVSVYSADMSDYSHSRYGLENPSLGDLPSRIADILEDKLVPKTETVVLGLEEFLYLPLQVASELESRGVRAYSSSTTRSPVVCYNREDYAVRFSINFAGTDGTARYAYNMGNRSTCIVIAEPGMDTDELFKPNGLVEGLTRNTYIEHVIIIEGETAYAS